MSTSMPQPERLYCSNRLLSSSWYGTQGCDTLCCCSCRRDSRNNENTVRVWCISTVDVEVASFSREIRRSKGSKLYGSMTSGRSGLSESRFISASSIFFSRFSLYLVIFVRSSITVVDSTRKEETPGFLYRNRSSSYITRPQERRHNNGAITISWSRYNIHNYRRKEQQKQGRGGAKGV